MTATLPSPAPAVHEPVNQPVDLSPEPIRDPAERTPMVTVDLATVGRCYDALQAALPGVALHYAVKANPHPAVLALLAGRGARWDVASPGELDQVLAVDPEPAHVSYGNTVKKECDVAAAHAAGVRRFAVDCDAELAKVVRRAPGATVLVRIATSGAGADWALGGKFGCTEAAVARLLADAAAAGHPVGVCFHVGSQQHRVDAWDAPLATVRRLRDRLRASGADLDVVDLGGGFPSASLQEADGSAGDRPTVADFGAAITAALLRHLGADLPALMAEPGRFLVGDAGTLETEVVLVTERAGTRWVYCDVGLFSGLAETMGEAIRYRVTAARDGRPLGGPVVPSVLAGPTCDSVDVMYERHRPLLPVDLRPGDRLLLPGTGAYTATYSSVGFNGFPPLEERCR